MHSAALRVCRARWSYRFALARRRRAREESGITETTSARRTAWRSLGLGLVAWAALLVGLFTPLLGRLLLYLAPALALAGVGLAGVAWARAHKVDSKTSVEFSRLALSLNTTAFLLSLLAAWGCTGCADWFGGESDDVEAPLDGAVVPEDSTPEASSFPRTTETQTVPSPTPGNRSESVADQVEVVRIQASLTAHCAHDPLGATARAAFHPAVFARLQPQVCTAERAISSTTRCTPQTRATAAMTPTGCFTAAPLEDTADARHSLPLGVAATDCRRYHWSSVTMIVCGSPSESVIVELEFP